MRSFAVAGNAGVPARLPLVGRDVRVPVETWFTEDLRPISPILNVELSNRLKGELQCLKNDTSKVMQHC